MVAKIPAPPAPTAAPITTVIADASDLSRGALRRLLAPDREFAVVAVTDADVQPLAGRHRPNLIVLDPELDEQLDLALIRRLRAASPESRLFIRTSVFDPSSFLQAMEAGVHGYTLKTNADNQFLHLALTLVGRYGAVVIGPAAIRRFRAGTTGTLPLTLSRLGTGALGARRQAVLQGLAEGRTRAQLAAALRVCPRTIDRDISHAHGTLGTKSLGPLIARAVQLGIVSVDRAEDRLDGGKPPPDRR